MEPIVNINLNSQAIIKDIYDLTADLNIVKVYANGFQLGLSLGDSSILIKQNEVPSHLITMSLPAMKSLYEQMGKILAIYGTDLGQQIISFDEMNESLRKKQTK